MKSHLEAINFKTSDPLERFTEDDKKIIEDRLHILSSLAYFIGKDYGMKVEVNPGQGWHWDFDKNVVRADPDDLLTKPIEFLRFVMSHEAGHRRISRVIGVIPDGVWKLPAFSFMMNALEDPRDNNFVADTVPHFRDEMKYAYGEDSEDAKFETEMQDEANKKFGKQPRFMQAGFEYIKLWYKVSIGEQPEVSPNLPDDVREVVLKTYEAAKRSWNTYPSLDEADNGLLHQCKQLTGEETITEYARASFQINYKEVWPLFNTLVNKDIEDAKNSGHGKGNGQGEAGNRGDGQEGGGDDTEPLTEEEARKLIEEFAKKLADHFEGEKVKADITKKVKASKFEPSGPEGSHDDETYKGKIVPEDVPEGGGREPFILDDKEIEKLKQKLEQRGTYENEYQQVLRECAPLIDHLTNELREIFDKRRHTRWEAGYKSGKKMHIGKVIQEEVSGTSPFDTGAFMRREQPKEADYVITLLVDLSGSMEGENIQEAFRASVVLSEALNQIGISFSVVGFNNVLHEYKDFNQELDDEVRQHSQSMLGEVDTWRARYNDDGWAVNEVNEKIFKREESQKIIFVISDGQPAPSSGHADYELDEVVNGIISTGKVKIIGLGLGEGTEHVATYYPNSVANINVQELSRVLGSKLREAIESV